MSNDMTSLDDFLGVVVANLQAPSERASNVSKLKALRRAAAADSVDPAERDRLRAESLALELQVDWSADMVIFVCEVEQCVTCGHEAYASGGIFIREQSRFKPTVTRHVRWSPQAIDGNMACLPKRHAFRTTRVNLCSNCAFAEGYTEGVEFPS